MDTNEEKKWIFHLNKDQKKYCTIKRGRGMVISIWAALLGRFSLLHFWEALIPQLAIIWALSLWTLPFVDITKWKSAVLCLCIVNLWVIGIIIYQHTHMSLKKNQCCWNLWNWWESWTLINTQMCNMQAQKCLNIDLFCSTYLWYYYRSFSIN